LFVLHGPVLLSEELHSITSSHRLFLRIIRYIIIKINNSQITLQSPM
jgi:hypothetical protein